MNHAPARIDRAQRRLAAAGGRHIGDLVSWNASNVDVSRDEARSLFAAERLGELIGDLDPATALSRAVAEVRRPPGVIVRPFAHPKSDSPAAFGVYIERGRDGEAGNDYLCGARCRVDRDRQTFVVLPPDGVIAIDEAMAHAEAVAEHAAHLVTHCETKDISSAMVAAIKRLSGVPLRDRGGFYLLPPGSCPTWDRLRRSLERIGVEPIRIEMHDAPDNLNAARAAARGALEADISELLGDLEKARTEGMRQHALVRRVELCKELAAKTELYRGVLAGLSDQIAARLGDVQRAFQQQLDGDGDAFAVAVND